VIFHQDNDPKHTSKLARECLEKTGMEIMKWPAQSPDFNPIEHLWSHLKQQLAKDQSRPKHILELWQCVSREWEDIPASVCQNLVESMPRRVRAVLRAKGGYTKY